MKTKTIRGFYLEYVTIKNVPLVKIESGRHGITAETWGHMEKVVAKEVLTRRIPLRGKEVKFLRKSFGISARDLAALMGLSHVAICPCTCA